MPQPREDPYAAPEVRAMHLEPELGASSDELPIDDVDANDTPDPDDVEGDIEAGRASEEDMAMAEDELEDQGEITAADQQFEV